MKRLFAILLVLTGLYSCWPEYGTKVTYFYENKSGVDIKIFDLDREKEIVSIANDMTYENLTMRGVGYTFLPFDATGRIEVIFNNDKSIIYTREDKTEDNPLSLDSYRLIVVKKKRESEEEYHYTFTEKQYQDAEPYVPGK